jgi:1-phosphatidylinositol-3-phosphate 5-kinase
LIVRTKLQVLILLRLNLQASFLEFAPAYFEHMARAAASGKPTTLAKVAGVYSITIRTQGGAPAAAAPGPGGQGGPFKDGSIDVLVMENIFYDRQISRIYDLKGSERSRFNADAAANPQDAGAVHLDDNLRRSNLQVRVCCCCKTPHRACLSKSAV